MRRYLTEYRWITPTDRIIALLERGDMVRYEGVVTSIVDLRRDALGTPYLSLANGADVPVGEVEVFEGHYTARTAARLSA